jgi:DNA-binding transcriptional LysR family regulator
VDRLEAMQIFVAVADEQSFAAAARRLGLTPARVTRAVAALERHVGARLLHRTTRLVRLSETGAQYFADARRILAELEQAEASAASAQASLSGQLSVTAPVLFGRMVVAPLLLEFLKRHPHVGIRASFSDQVVDLIEQNIDVAVRISHLADSGLTAVRVGFVERVVCASPAYLRAHGVPRHPRDLTQHDLIAFSGLGEPHAWRFQRDDKSEIVHPKSRLVVNSADLAIAAAIAGHGLTKVLSYQIGRELEERRLRVVLSEFQGPPVPVHVVHAAGRNASRRLRAFVELAVDRLRESLG